MKRPLIYILIPILFFCQAALAQDTINFILKPNYAQTNTDQKILYFYDGAPIFHGSEVINAIDPHSVESISLSKTPIYNCLYEKLYDAFLIIETKDSVNTGLKHIISSTNKWTFRNPTAKLIINGTKTDWEDGIDLLTGLTPQMVKNIEVVERSHNAECDPGSISIEISSF